MITSSTIFIIIVAFVIAEFLLDKVLDYLNAKSWDAAMPEIVKGLYDNEKYEKAKNYAKENGRLSLISGLLSFAILLTMLFGGGFAFLDGFVRGFTSNEIMVTLLFFAIISVASTLIHLPFSWHKTFTIEEKYGFNKTTPKTFVLDFLKGLLMSAIIGGGLLALLTFLFLQMGNNFWWIAWIAVGAFTIFFGMFYTTLIVPLFNKLTPLEEGELRESIETYASKVDFPLTKIMVMDGSKRSSKANAYFSGLGKQKTIVLYDTLMNDNTVDEITGILAHEVGHYKKKHVLKGMALSLFQMGFLFFLFGWIAKSNLIHEAFGAAQAGFHLSLIGFGLLYTPISLLIGILMNMYSRKNEFEADAYAKETFNATSLVSALRKLSVNHLSNLTPNKIYSFIHFSHPPLVERLTALLK